MDKKGGKGVQRKRKGEVKKTGERKKHGVKLCENIFAEGGDGGERVNQHETRERRAIAEGERRVGGEWRDQSPMAPVL